jgi:Xaa-Pro aminopeptidase
MTAADKPHAARLALLRQRLAKEGLAGLVIPRGDEHQGEYVPPRAERLAWLTGFTGSAGEAVVLADRAAIFVDGRYTEQAREQVDPTLFEHRHQSEQPIEDYIKRHLPEGGRLGIDPWLFSKDQAQRLKRAAEAAGGSLAPVEPSPLDAVWEDQPAAPAEPIKPHPIEFAGETSAAKRASIGKALADLGADVTVLTLPDSIAWLLNVRGSDVQRNPFPLSFAILERDGRVTWFVSAKKLGSAARESLDAAVETRAPEDFAATLDSLKGKRVLIDPATAPLWLFERLKAAGATVIEGSDPCQLPKAAKNAIEQEGARNAHRRDGVAVTRFLSWFAKAAPTGITESQCAVELEKFRRQGNLFQDLSFDTITGSGANGALPHYRVSEQSDRRLQPGDLMVLDSGGQYLDGTTDITRTLVVGKPAAEERDRYTRVLQGHIALATTRFPKGTSGSQLDAIARRPLWLAGLDYDHGTGHGVGSYLSVHEGPQRISKAPNRVALLPGMILSNEPGYYKAGRYGIRIENLVLVVETPTAAGEDRPMLGFETLTLAPIEKRLIEPRVLSDDEIAWLDAYHARVEAELGPQLQGEDRAFLAEACKPLLA